MQALGFEINPILPWSVLVIFVVSAIGILVLMAYLRAPGVLWRMVFLIAGYVALLNPTFVKEQREYLPDVVALVIDHTESQQIGDRLETTQSTADELRSRLENLLNLEIRSTVVEDAGDGEGTRLFESLREVLSDVPVGRVAGSIFITDGQVHDVPKISEHIEYAGPIHVLLTGDATEEDRRLIIEDAPKYSVIGDTVKVLVRVEDSNARGELVPVRLSVDGKEQSTTSVKIGNPTEIEIALDREGLMAFEFDVEPGPSELTLENNRSVASINGVRERMRVMLVSGEPGPGLRTLRNMLKADPAVDLVHFTVLRPPNKQDLTPVSELSLIPFPSGELFSANLQKFDLVIFDRYHRRGILPVAYLSNLVDYVLAGGAVLDIAGPSFSSSLSLATTPLSKILPAHPTGKVSEVAFLPLLSRDGLRHPVTSSLYKNDEEEESTNQPTWGRWFRLMEAEVLRGKILMQSPDQRPLLVLDRIGNGRVGQLLSDQSWLWARGFEGGGPQQDLLRRLVHWLMKQPDLEEEFLSATVERHQINIVRKSLSPVTKPATVKGPNGKVEVVSFTESGGGQATATLTVQDRGLYKISHGQLSAVATVGTENSLEIADVRTTDKILSAVAAASSGSIAWLGETGLPDVRSVAKSASKTGPGWIGLQKNESFRVAGLVRVPIAHELLLLLFLLGSALMAWRKEGY